MATGESSLSKTLLAVGRYNEARTNALAAVADYAGGIEMRLLARRNSTSTPATDRATTAN